MGVTYAGHPTQQYCSTSSAVLLGVTWAPGFLLFPTHTPPQFVVLFFFFFFLFPSRAPDSGTATQHA